MHLVRDLLDQQLVDRRKRPMGRVDGVILELRSGAAPRVVALESGLATLARRLHPRLVPLVERIERRLGVSDGRALRYRCATVRRIAVDVELDVDAVEVGADAWERWLRARLLRHIPGAR